MEIFMYKNCIFDLYGTLIDIRTNEESDEFWDSVAEIYKSNGADYTPAQIKSDYHKYAKCEKEKQRSLHPEYTHIDINLENVFYKLYKSKGIDPTSALIQDTAKKFRKSSTIFIKLYDGVIDLLETLKASGKSIYLLSNAQRSFTYPEMVELGIEKYFDGILISSDCGCAKPQKQFFDCLLDKYSLDPEESIMIGNDCISDIEGAHNAGLDSLYIHQDISTPLEGRTLYSKWSIMDGDVYKIKEYILHY